MMMKSKWNVVVVVVVVLLSGHARAYDSLACGPGPDGQGVERRRL